MTVQWIEGTPTPPAAEARLHRSRVRWFVLAGYAAKWMLVWYVTVVCLSFYPFDLVWRIGSGKIGGAIWLAVTIGAMWMIARDIREEIARSRR